MPGREPKDKNDNAIVEWPSLDFKEHFPFSIKNDRILTDIRLNHRRHALVKINWEYLAKDATSHIKGKFISKERQGKPHAKSYQVKPSWEVEEKIQMII